MTGHVEIDQELCKACRVCIAFCPKDAIAPLQRVNAAGYVPVAPRKDGNCTGCGICAIVCPEVAIEVYRD